MVNSIRTPAPEVSPSSSVGTKAEALQQSGDAKADETAAAKSMFISAAKKPEQFRNYGQDTPRYETVRAFYEEQHTKQTYAFASAALKKYTSSSRCTMPVWDALMYVLSSRLATAL